MIPAPLPALAREGEGRGSPALRLSQLGEPAREGEWAEPLGWERGGREGRVPLQPRPGCLQSAEPYVSVQGAQDMSQQRLLGAGLGLPLKSLP